LPENTGIVQTMKNPRRKTILWLISTLMLAMLPQVISMPLPVLMVAVLPLLWRLGSELNGWKPLPALVRHGATALALAALFLSYGDLSGRRAAVSLLTVMLTLKLVECYRIRDARLVVCFSMFLCATQFLFSQGILMPLYGGATIILGMVTLAQLQRSEAWAHEDSPPPLKVSLLSELGFSFRLVALAIPVGLVSAGELPPPSVAALMGEDIVGEHTESIRVMPGTGIIVISYFEDTVRDGGQVFLEPYIDDDGYIEWVCSGTIAERHLPAACRGNALPEEVHGGA
jgi:hypothetical protein